MRILLLTSDLPIAAAVSGQFRVSGQTVDVVHSTEELLAAVVGEAFDVIIIDDLSKFQMQSKLLESVRYSGEGTPIIAFTSDQDSASRIACLNLGADDCLSKPFDLDELESRVRAVIRRRFGLVSDVMRFGELEFDLETGTATLNGDVLELARKERSILEILVAHRGKLVQKQHIYNNLYGFDGCEVGIATVPVYISRLRKKLRSNGISIRNVRHSGYQIHHLDDEERLSTAA